jgi:hypothetical protein
MTKKQIVKIEKIVNVNPLSEYTENELEAAIPTKEILVKPTTEIPIVEKPIKKKINISDEERERRKQSMINVRLKKMDNVKQRKLEQDLYMQSQEEEINNKVIKKTELLKKKQEKSVLQKLIKDELYKNVEQPKQVVSRPQQAQPQQISIKWI